jgi:pimeloyl-ACP methyl ester carboxylesterase
MVALAFVLAAAGGCGSRCVRSGPERPHEIVYYVDGAGGGGPIAYWGGGVELGLRQAGHRGAFVNYKWQTGLGALTDQKSSIRYKRSRAAGLARLITDHLRCHPNAEVTVIGLSAGTAIAVLALEALPPDPQVRDVFLISSSLSSDYDLTAALRRVQGNVHVFISPDDGVLGLLVPLVGTADGRYCGRCSAGLVGFRVPRYASAETRYLYSKVRNISSDPLAAHEEDNGGHTAKVNAAFVRDRIAPMLLRESPRFTVVGSTGEEHDIGTASTQPS